MSKLWYGLQLCSNVRTLDSEKKNSNLKSAQIAQNKLLRLLTNTSIKEKNSTSELLEKSEFQSVNQLAANIKLLEAWKSINLRNYPIRMEPNYISASNVDRQLRPSASRDWNQDGRSTAAKESFSRNTAKIWNAAPKEIKTAKTIFIAKKAIKSYCKTLPI